MQVRTNCNNVNKEGVVKIGYKKEYSYYSFSLIVVSGKEKKELRIEKLKYNRGLLVNSIG